jgi:hypothetical protein
MEVGHVHAGWQLAKTWYAWILIGEANKPRDFILLIFSK